MKIPNKISGGENADIASGSYTRTTEDIQILKDLGVKSYRFSIAWSRIMPTGKLPVNDKGIQHYNKFINELIKVGIEPIVTLFHWDLPMALELAYGGWLDGPRIEVDFSNYADICFTAFGDRVKTWITINEPWTVCFAGYFYGVHAPGRCTHRSQCTMGNSTTEPYIAAHNFLNAHAIVVELYRTKYYSQKGLIGIALNHDWAEPLTQNHIDILAAERRNIFAMGWFADPLVYGKYPNIMVKLIGDRLPKFSPEQSKRLKGSYDYFFLNHYSTKYFSHKQQLQHSHKIIDSSNGWIDDQMTIESSVDIHGKVIGPEGALPWMHTVPWGFYNVLMWSHKRYSKNGKVFPIIIAENGVAVKGENDIPLPQVLNDEFRWVTNVVVGEIKVLGIVGVIRVVRVYS